MARERDPGFIAVLWVSGVLKAVGGLLAWGWCTVTSGDAA
jgi:hypothetical protein